MSWPEKASISKGVEDMLRVNMGLESGEKLLVVADVPGTLDWQTKSQSELQSMLERTVLARLVADVAGEHFPDCSVCFLPFPATGRHGTEPDEGTAHRLRQADVVIALTTYSLSHTKAREGASKAGARVASMPTFEVQMFEAGGAMTVDHQQMALECQAFADLLTSASEALVRTAYGTDLRFSLAGRTGCVDNGLYLTKGLWGNLPAGEAYIAPLEGTGQGRLVVPAGWYPKLSEAMAFRFEKGEVTELEGGGAVGDRFRQLLNLGSDDLTYKARRNLAELGIGTNPNAHRPDSELEGEKIKGTVHIGIGDNLHMGGQVESDLHQDFVQPQVDLFLDGQRVIAGGEWEIQALG